MIQSSFIKGLYSQFSSLPPDGKHHIRTDLLWRDTLRFISCTEMSCHLRASRSARLDRIVRNDEAASSNLALSTQKGPWGSLVSFMLGVHVTPVQIWGGPPYLLQHLQTSGGISAVCPRNSPRGKPNLIKDNNKSQVAWIPL